MTRNRNNLLNELESYSNKWIALVDSEVIASGDTVKAVKEKADQTGRKEYSFYFVLPQDTSLMS